MASRTKGIIMKKEIITNNAPGAIGPYSQGVETTSFVFTSGQLPIKDGEMPATIEEQTKNSLNNVKAILEEQGLSMKDVVKTTVFLSDMNNFVAMNGVYETFFEKPYPARSAVEVARLPKDALVEIEAIATK